MEELIARILEQSIVSGGFLLLLVHVLHKQEKQLDTFTKQLETFAGQMSKSNTLLLKISNTLSTFDERLQRLEGRDKNAD